MYQDVSTEKQRIAPQIGKHSQRVGEEIPPIITKKWLYGHFQISPTNKAQLYRLVLTSEVLEFIGLELHAVRTKSFRSFDAIQSRNLAKILFP